MSEQFVVPDEAHWLSVGQELLRRFPHGAAVGLSGDLGAGKTAFVRVFVTDRYQVAGQSAPRVASPTYLLRQSYEECRPKIEHFDLYRLENADEATLETAGYFDALERVRRDRAFLFVEWPEKAADVDSLDLDATLHITLREEGRLATLNVRKTPSRKA